MKNNMLIYLFISLFFSGNLRSVEDLPPQHCTNQRHQVCVIFVTPSFIISTAKALKSIGVKETIWMDVFHFYLSAYIKMEVAINICCSFTNQFTF